MAVENIINRNNKQKFTTMETKHTKGEWNYTEKSLTSPTRIITSKDWGTIAHVTTNIYRDRQVISDEEIESNAKLIAAAPELLENLIRCVDRLEENDMGNMSAVRRAKEAIKKATE